MSRRLLLTLFASFLLVVGTIPALADEDAAAEGLSDTDPKWTLLEAEFDGLDWTAGLKDELIGTELGWGDIFKILAMLTTEEDPVFADLFAELCDGTTGECDFAWGEFKLAMAGDEDFASMVKNLGQLVSAAKRGHGRPGHAVGPDGTPPGKDKAPGTPAARP